MRPWNDWRWVAAVAGLLFAVAITTVAVTSVTTGEQVQDQEPLLIELQRLVEINTRNIAAIDRSLENTDELVAFVHEVQADSAANEGGQSDAVVLIVGLICSMEDPGVQTACAALQPEATP